MIRIIIFVVIVAFAFGSLIYVIQNPIGEYKKPKEKIEKKTELDYWYTHPHYFVFEDGTQINMADYITFDEYKLKDKASLARMLHTIKCRLDNGEELKKIDIKEGL